MTRPAASPPQEANSVRPAAVVHAELLASDRVHGDELASLLEGII